MKLANIDVLLKTNPLPLLQNGQDHKILLLYFITRKRIFFHRFTSLIYCLLLLAPPLPAQFNHAPDQQWRSIETDHFQIIFDSRHEVLAQRVANICEAVYHPVSRDMGFLPPRTPVILHSKTDVANAFVTLFPYRMELFLADLQLPLMGASTEWLRLLITHEFRHVVQLRYQSGFVLFARAAFGEQAEVLPLLGLPRWWLEGDATISETKFTGGGRGRSPYFNMELAAQLLEKGPFSYQKAYFGSNRDHVPSIYHLGYYLTNQIAADTSLRVQKILVDKFYTLPLGPPGFNVAVRWSTGQWLNSHYQLTMKKLRDAFQHELQEQTFSRSVNLKDSGNNEIPVSYFSPRYARDGSVLAIKRGFDQLPRIVRISTDGTESVVLERQVGEELAVAGNMLGWREIRPHWRWGWQQRSKVQIFDQTSRHFAGYATGDGYLWMDLSTDGRKIVGAANDGLYSNLIIEDLLQGRTTRLTSDSLSFYNYPRFSHDGSAVVAIKRNGQFQQVLRFSLQNGLADTILSSRKHQFAYPVMSPDNKRLFFSADLDGFFDIYVINLHTGAVHRVVNSRYGAFLGDIAANGREILFSEYTASGFQLKSMRLDSSRWEPANQLLLNDQQAPLIFDVSGEVPDFEDRVYPVDNFNLLNRYALPHSWGIFLEPSGQVEEGRYGLFVLGNDPLYRYNWSANVSYDVFRKTVDSEFSLRYDQLWPQIELDLFVLQDALFDSADDTVAYWKEAGGNLGLSLPILLRQNIYRSTVTPFAGISLSKIYDQESVRGFPDIEQQKRSYFAGITVSNLKAVPNRGLGILRDGQRISVDIENVDPSQQFDGQRLRGSMWLFAPGLFNHHGIALQFAYIRQNGNFYWENERRLPRGYSGGGSGGSMVIRSDYRLPLAYLDLHIPYVSLYLKNSRLGVFFDSGDRWNRSEAVGDLGNLQSTGVEWDVEVYPFQLPASLRIGLRYVYRLQDKGKEWQLLLSF